MSEPKNQTGIDAVTPSDVARLGFGDAVKRRAVKAFGHLLGVRDDEPPAKKDAPPTSTEVSTKLGKLRERARARVTQEEVRAQEAREEIAKKTMEYLSSEDPDFSESGALDEDWLNLFGRHSENASSDRLRDLWGKILSGEVRKPGSFSLSTLRLVSELDKEIATKFQSAIKSRILWAQSQFILKPKELRGQQLLDYIFLEEIGLLQQVAGMGGLQLSQEISAEGRWHFNANNLLLIGEGQPNHKFDIEVIAITRVGREVASILPFDGLSGMRNIAKRCSENFDKLTIHRVLAREGDQLRTQPIEVVKGGL